MSADSANIKLAPCPACGGTAGSSFEGKACARAIANAGLARLLEAERANPEAIRTCALDNLSR